MGRGRRQVAGPVGVPAAPAAVVALLAVIAAVLAVLGVPAVPAAHAEPGAGVVPGGADFITGGADLVTGGAHCSAGFGVRTPGGTPRLLTAGHCTRLGGDVRAVTAEGVAGAVIGPVRSSRYGREGDWGVVDVAAPFGTPPRVGGDPGVALTGVAEVGVGASVCRWGAATGRRCGTVIAVGVAANYGAGPIGGLTAITACSEPGDSGGPVVSGTTAVGLLSGGSGDCARGGVSLVQPLRPVLDREGLQLVTG